MSARNRPVRRWSRWVRPGFWLLFTGLVAAIVHVSWLRWMDPFIDFGREVYMPWRILAGEHPGRDFVHLYGPFSTYWNAGLFAVFGTSILTLVVANLAVFGGVAILLFVVTRRAFGFLPAATTVAVAVPVYGFSHYDGINNYTYAAPYSHEAIHGMLFLLAALAWLGRPGAAAFRPTGGVVAGVLFGLCALTKTEYVLVAGLLWGACAVRLLFVPGNRGAAMRWLAGSVVGAAAVGAIAWGLLSLALPMAEAARLAGNALLAPFSYRALAQSPLGQALLGTDRTAENFAALLTIGAGAFAALAILAWLCRRSLIGRRISWLGPAAVFVSVALAIAWVPWLSVATAFPVLLLGGLAWLTWSRRATEGVALSFRGRSWNQVLFGLAGLGMLARMALAPTVDHYGFFQALLAGTWVGAFLVSEWPRVAGGPARRQLLLALAMIGLLAGGATKLWQRSLLYYRVKNFELGEGADAIRSYGPDTYGLPSAFEQVRAFLTAKPTSGRTLVVVPEGMLLNYWTRHRLPLRIFDLLPATLKLNPRPVVEDLAASPPDTIVLVSRDMSEFGFSVYGANEASGKTVMDWIAKDYTRIGFVGDYPFQEGKLGVWLLRRNGL